MIEAAMSARSGVSPLPADSRTSIPEILPVGRSAGGMRGNESTHTNRRYGPSDHARDDTLASRHRRVPVAPILLLSCIFPVINRNGERKFQEMRPETSRRPPPGMTGGTALIAGSGRVKTALMAGACRRAMGVGRDGRAGDRSVDALAPRLLRRRARIDLLRGLDHGDPGKAREPALAELLPGRRGAQHHARADRRNEERTGRLNRREHLLAQQARQLTRRIGMAEAERGAV